MPSTVLDSDIFKDMFGTAEMRAVFSDDNLLKCYVEAEIALAAAQGRLGVIPRDAADAIARLAPTVALDREALKHEAENVGYPILGLVRQLSEKLGEAGRYVHWGATTQDIMDTATVLQIRTALAIIERDMSAVLAALDDVWGQVSALLVLDQVSETDCGVVTAGVRARIAQIAQEHKLTRMATLTLDPERVPNRARTDRYIRERWRMMRVLLAREFKGSLSFVGVLEFQKNGNAHLHVLLGQYITQKWLSKAWQSIGGGKMQRCVALFVFGIHISPTRAKPVDHR